MVRVSTRAGGLRVGMEGDGGRAYHCEEVRAAEQAERVHGAPCARFGVTISGRNAWNSKGPTARNAARAQAPRRYCMYHQDR